MDSYKLLSGEKRKSEHDKLMKIYDEYKSRGLALDMSRGKPSKDQLDLSLPMLETLKSTDILKAENGLDARNYGMLDGLPEAKRLFSEILNIEAKNIIVGGTSSLNLMYDTVARAMSFGVYEGCTPWNKLEKVKFLCPVPGYDRHFGICELFGIEMINIPMDNNGPDMNLIEDLVANDETIKGIWCVPMYANPNGVTYSEEVVRRFSKLSPKAKDFRIFWDNAYCVHHLTDTPDCLLNIFDECKKSGSEDMLYIYASTSKISFSGAGVAVLAASDNNIKYIKKLLAIQTIGFDKVNQLRHVRFFKNLDGIKAHMQLHKAIIKPKFDAVLSALSKEIAPLDVASWSVPNGGYFVSFDAMDGCAKKIVSLCREAGVVMTPAGASFPYGKDDNDKNIRIAPTFPPISELNT
ncbi:MAG: aminotransferase class I/II-fold pyridoxal phosphate-dependent enzyme, partial [Oscillospiraceae bacterium]